MGKQAATVPGKVATTTSSHEERREQQLMLDHAATFWQAEVNNSERHAKEFQVTTGISAGVAAIAALTRMDRWGMPSGETFASSARWWYLGCAIFVAVLFYGVSKKNVLPTAAIRISLLAAALSVFAIHSLLGECRVFVVVFNGVLYAAALVYLLGGMVALIGRRDLPPKLAGRPASVNMLLSKSRIARSNDVMDGAEWAVFRRVYASAVELHASNRQLKGTLTLSQNLLYRGILLLLGAVLLAFLLRVTDTREASKPDQSSPATEALNVSIPGLGTAR